ncbi:hypothetical protein DB30_02298 [Enhygromyxa salina]|uniref:Uncharacterized protein n=1 Tax=Enhygromyxa salina TaxID=215803 RepID=A0A0C2CQC0_9BACT|nr:hypothetical protein [Enhygromyxa salina]KIG11915.1 hypothetical protein DB30_02298 [Enhygromyxa salina]
MSASIHARPLALPLLTMTLALALGSAAGCKDPPPASESANSGDAANTPPAAADSAASPTEAPEAAASNELDLLLAWLPPDPLGVAYDRLGERLDPAILAVVYAIPPKAADLLDERATLDEGLDVVFDGDAEPTNWLEPSSLAFSVALSKSPYFVRRLRKDAAELPALFEQGGFAKNTVDEIDVWLPGGSFPWRIAVLGEVVAFIPVDVPGAGLEPLTTARDQDTSPVEQELARALSEDPMIDLVLFAAGPLVHFDVSQTIAQVQFALRRVPGPGTKFGYEGQVRLDPSGDVDECANALRARAHPEENQQVQQLISEIAFTPEQGGVVGRLAIAPEQVKHFADR